MSRTPAPAPSRTESAQPAPAANRLQDELGNAAITEEIACMVDESASGTSTLDALTDEVAKPEAAAPEPTPTTVPSGTLGDVYRDHQAKLPGMGLRPTSEHKWGMNHFKKTYEANAERYDAVAKQTGIPAKLIAALHYRESSMRFDTYLHQGDKLGKPAVHVPKNIPVFDEWEDGAVHALGQKANIRDQLGMDENTTDPAALATFAERYNGLGYHYKGKPSPYVYAGTDVYRGGKYVADGKYDPRVWDRQPGVMALMASLDQGENGEMPEWANPQKPEEAWGAVSAGTQVVREGQRGPAINALQDKLGSAGFDTGGVDGQYGKNTRQAVIEFQKAHGLTPDGVVGPATAAALDEATKAPEPEAGTETVADGPMCEIPHEHDAAPEALTETEETVEAAPEQPKADPWRDSILKGALLVRGGKGSAISELQNRLIAAGHDIKADGDFGPKTRAAVKAFQRAHGLKPDGVVGPQTVSAFA